MEYKITIHCGPINTFLLKDFADMEEAIAYSNSLLTPDFFRFGDMIVNGRKITFVQVQPVEPIKNEEGTIEVDQMATAST